MGFNDINLQVSGPQQPASIYKTKVLKGQVPFAVQVTEPNTKYVIKHNFVLNGDVTIPENCILEFDGGSISGEYILNGNGAIIIAKPRKIFNNPNIPGYGSFNTENGEIYPEWFGVDDIGVAISAACRVSANRTVVKLQPKTYHLTTPAKLISSNVIDLNNAIIMVDEDVPAFVDINYGDASAHYQVANIMIKNGYLTVNKARTQNYLIDIANSFYLTIKQISTNIANGITLNKYCGIRLGRKTSDYHDALFVNTIKDCILYHVTIEPQVTDSYLINNKIWASNTDEGAITIHSSSWQIISNQIVGGLKGGIYIPDNTNLSGLKIIGNYFDGSYYNIDTQNGINIGNDSSIANSVINGNNFWHQKGRGIYGSVKETSITGNVFDDCDFYNEGLPDIELTKTRNVTISANTFIRNIYVTTSGVHHSRADEVKTPPIIKITESLYDSESYIIGNTCYGKLYYGIASYHENIASNNARVFSMYNNIDVFNNNGYYGSGANRPTNVREGFLYFDYNLGKPIWWFANKWIDATGATV